MGWSCNAAASLALDAVSALMRHKADMAYPPDSPHRSGADSYRPGEVSSNATPAGFWERSNVEHRDGAITGTTWKHVGPDRCRKAGSFRIEGNGTVTRFPGLTADERAECSAKAKGRYFEAYGQPTQGW